MTRIGMAHPLRPIDIAISPLGCGFETGQIALAFRSDIEPDVSLDRVREMILRHSGRQSGLAPMPEPEWKRAEP